MIDQLGIAMTATLHDRLQVGVIERRRRWSGDTHDDLGGTVDVEKTDALMLEAAAELSRLESARESAVVEIDRLRRERDEWHGRAAESVRLRRERDDHAAEIDRLRAELTVMKGSCAQAGKDAVQFQDDRDALAAENDRLRRQLEVHQAANPALLGTLGRAGDDPVGFFGER